MRVQRPALAERYAIHLPLDLGDIVSRYVGTDVSTGQTIVVAFLEPELVSLGAQGVGCLHRHLAGIVDSVSTPSLESFPDIAAGAPSGTAVVAELIRGSSLADVMHGKAVGPDRAVAWMIRILEGLQSLHQRQSPHGALSSHAVIAEPKGRPIAPVVSQLIVPPLKDYASPERLAGSGPTLADDLWAAGLVLFEMLTGKLPWRPEDTNWGRFEIKEADLQRVRALPHGRELEVILRRVLASDRQRRPGSVEELLDMLDRWEQRIALPVSVTRTNARATPLTKNKRAAAPWDRLVTDFEGGGKRLQATLDAAEHMRQTVLSDRPESTVAARNLLAGSHGPVAMGQKGVSRSNRPGVEGARHRMKSFGPELAAFRERSKPKFGRLLIALVGAVGLLAIGAYVFAMREDSSVRTAVASAEPKAAAIAAPSKRRPARPKLTASEERAQCIRSYFRPDTVVDGMNLEFVCTEEDFLAVNRRLHDDALVAAPVPEPAGSSGAPPDVGSARRMAPASPPMIVRSEGASPKGWQLGWYELVATAIIRQSCCREAAPIKLPESTGWCQQLQAVVRRIATDSGKVGDISPGVRTFDEAINCLLAQGLHGAYPYKTLPTFLQKSAFQQFLKNAAEADARRTANR